MRHSLFVPMADGRLVFTGDVLSSMGLGRDGLVYALPLRRPFQGAVLSVIPPAVWHRSFRIVSHTHHAPGSLQGVAEALAEGGYNTISASAAATTSGGQLCFTAIVDVPEATADQADAEAVIRDDLLGRLDGRGLLANKDESIYEAVSPDLSRFFPIYVSKCRKLAAFRESQPAAVAYAGPIEHHVLDLKAVMDSEYGNTLWDKLLAGREPPRLAMLSPDSGERYTQIVLLGDRDIRQVDMKIRVIADASGFTGSFESVLEGIKEKHYNIYSATNTLVAKGVVADVLHDHELLDEACGELTAVEEAEYSLCIDVAPRGLSDDDAIANDISGAVSRSLRAFSKRGVRCGSIVGDGVRVQRVGRPWKCFLATNAKDPGTAKKALKLHDRLVAMGLDPVHVVTADGAGKALYRQAREMLDCCPILVSFYTPEQANELAHEPDRAPGRYGASDWVLFEQSYMMAIGRSVFQVQYDTVRVPKFVPGRIYKFKGTNASFERALNDLELAIKEHFTQQKWAESVGAAFERTAHYDGFPRHGDVREYLERVIKAGPQASRWARDRKQHRLNRRPTGTGLGGEMGSAPSPTH